MTHSHVSHAGCSPVCQIGERPSLVRRPFFLHLCARQHLFDVLTYNVLTHNVLTHNVLTHNVLTYNVLTYNVLKYNSDDWRSLHVSVKETCERDL